MNVKVTKVFGVCFAIFFVVNQTVAMADTASILNKLTIEQGGYQIKNGAAEITENTVLSGKFAIPTTGSVAFRGVGDNLHLMIRDTSGIYSKIYGSLDINNLTFALINNSGIILGKTGRINGVNANVILSTLHMRADDFFKDTYDFYNGNVYGPIVNDGVITGDNLVALVSSAIKNNGALIADLGQIVMAAGNKLTLTMDNQGLIGVILTEEVSAAIAKKLGLLEQIKNNGTISAKGGRILINAAIAKEAYICAVNNQGIIRANSIVEHEGEIHIKAEGGPIIFENTSELDVAPSEPGAIYGKITVDSDRGIFINENITSIPEQNIELNGHDYGEWLVNMDDTNIRRLLEIDDPEEFLLEIAKDTWKFFEENASQYNDLILDVVEIDSNIAQVYDTSVTNIGWRCNNIDPNYILDKAGRM